MNGWRRTQAHWLFAQHQWKAFHNLLQNIPALCSAMVPTLLTNRNNASKNKGKTSRAADLSDKLNPKWKSDKCHVNCTIMDVHSTPYFIGTFYSQRPGQIWRFFVSWLYGCRSINLAHRPTRVTYLRIGYGQKKSSCWINKERLERNFQNLEMEV